MKHRRKLSNMLVIREIMYDSLLSRTAKDVGVAIALHRNLSTLLCCPSQNTLSMMTGIACPKAVRKGISELSEKAYLIIVKSREEGSAWDSSHYFFLRDFAAQRVVAARSDFQGDLVLFMAAWSKAQDITVNGVSRPTNSIVTRV